MIKLMSTADGISLLNALFGFFAVFFLFTWEVHLAFSFILLALLADGVDGIVARKMGKSKIGEYLEAMADMLSLSVAPLLFFLTTYSNVFFSSMLIRGVTTGVIILFLVASILRLSSFHILKQNDYFVGLPASASTIFILVFSVEQVSFYLTLSVVVLCGLFMLSSISFPKPTRTINGVATVLILLAIVFGNTFAFLLWVLFAAILLYSIGGPIWLSLKKQDYK